MRIHNCAFCREYEKTVGVSEIEKHSGCVQRLRVCLYSFSKDKLGKERYRKHHTPMKLKFCPSCGKALSRKEHVPL